MIATKTVFTGISMATILLFGGGIFLYMNLSNIAKPITERLATEALGVPVSIGKMEINLPEKTVQVSGLKIRNPKGYKRSHILTVGDIKVELGKVSKELIIFKNINVSGTDVNLEVTPNGTNLNDLKKGISTKAPNKKATAAGDKIKVIINHFNFTSAKLNPSVTLLSEQSLDPIIVPDITLNNIGQKENGILAREAIAQILDHILKTLNKSSGQAGFLNGLSKDTLKDMGQSQIDGVKDQVKDEIKNIGNQIKGIFGK